MSAYAVGEESETESSVSDPMSQVPAENAYEKIHFYFDTAEYANLESVSELATATASVKTDYAAALGVAQRRSTDADVNENVYITVQFVSDYMEDETYKTLKAARENAKTADERDEAKTNMNRYSKQYHADLVAENLPTLSAIPYTAFHAIDYSSFVTLTVPAESLNASVLEEVADQDNILHISLTDGFEVVDCSDTSTDEEELYLTAWDDVMDCINATNVLQATNASGKKLHTGEGVKVGVYESSTITVDGWNQPNWCDITNPNISPIANAVDSNNNPKLTLRCYESEPPVNNGAEWHGTEVMSVLTNMLPDAYFFFTVAPGFFNGIMIEGISWFISQGCDVVNCSFNFGNYGYRYDIDAVYDYQIENNDIVVVVSAGNVAGDYQSVGSPGNARNVITVGGVQGTENGEWEHAANRACYVTTDEAVKPNVSAPFNVEIDNISEICRGTSFSTPLVTACAALYFEYYNEYISSSAVPSPLVRSVVMASANKTSDYQMYGLYQTADQKVGAGIVDLGKMLSTNVSILPFTVTAAAMSEFKSVSIYLTAGKEVCIALNWNLSATSIAYNANSGGSINAPNIDLRLYNNNGNIVARSAYDGNSSTEYIRYTVSVTGYYRIVLYNREVNSFTKQYGLAYSKQ